MCLLRSITPFDWDPIEGHILAVLCWSKRFHRTLDWGCFNNSRDVEMGILVEVSQNSKLEPSLTDYNVPSAFLALLGDMISIPNSFPHHKRPEKQSRLKLSSLRQLDILGALLLLGLSVCLVAALQEANVNFAWSSGVVTALLVISGTSLIGFTLWERLLMVYDRGIIPVLSWAFATRRSLGLFMYIGRTSPDGMHAN